MASVNPLIYKGVYQSWSLTEPNISCAVAVYAARADCHSWRNA
jgi:hypothetical protein